jgi:hypothetical protein
MKNNLLADAKQQLADAKQQASLYGLDVHKSEAMLQEVEKGRHLSDKYRRAFYLATTGCYSADDLAEILGYKPKNFNSNFNKNLGDHIKTFFNLDDEARLGIASLRRFLFQKGYVNDNYLVNILAKRFQQNAQLEEPSSPDRAGIDETATN